MKTDILTVIDTGGDDSTGFYVNGKKVVDIHCNDAHEIPDVLYELMTENNISKVVKKRLTDEATERVFGIDGVWEHPESLSDYAPEDFE